MSFKIQVCPQCESKQFDKLKIDSIICKCGFEFITNQEAFITGKKAQEILEITTRQGLEKIVKRYNITKVSQGAGKPNLYHKDETIKAFLDSHKQKEKFNPDAKVKAVKTKEKKTETAAKKETAKKEIEKKTKNPLNETGQDEFIRVQGELKGLGIYEEKDRAILLSYCICYQNYMFYIDLSASLSHTTTDDNGNDKVNPYFTVADKLLSQMIKLSSILGIGKRSTIGLDIKPVAEESMISQLLKS